MLVLLLTTHACIQLLNRLLGEVFQALSFREHGLQDDLYRLGRPLVFLRLVELKNLIQIILELTLVGYLDNSESVPISARLNLSFRVLGLQIGDVIC